MIALPCPFCGTDPGLARVSMAGSIVTYTVGCEADDCPCNPQLTAFSYESAWSRWNMRAPVKELVP